MSLEHVSPEDKLDAIEAGLRSLVPAQSLVNRDRVMFVAGQASARRSSRERHAWIAVAASLALVALGEGALLLARPAPRVVERVVVVREPAVNSPVPGSVQAVERTSAELTSVFPGSLGVGWTAREMLTQQLVLFGLDGLPPSSTTVRSDSDGLVHPSAKALREELIKDLGLGDRS